MGYSQRYLKGSLPVRGLPFLLHQNAHHSVPVLMIMRTYALYSRNRKVPLFLGSIIVVGGCVSLVRLLLIASPLPIKLLTFPATPLCSGQSARRCSRYLDRMREARISTSKGASWSCRSRSECIRLPFLPSSEPILTFACVPGDNVSGRSVKLFHFLHLISCLRLRHRMEYDPRVRFRCVLPHLRAGSQMEHGLAPRPVLPHSTRR